MYEKKSKHFFGSFTVLCQCKVEDYDLRTQLAVLAAACSAILIGGMSHDRSKVQIHHGTEINFSTLWPSDSLS